MRTRLPQLNRIGRVINGKAWGVPAYPRVTGKAGLHAAMGTHPINFNHGESVAWHFKPHRFSPRSQTVVNPLQRIRDRIEARRAREALTDDQRLYIDRISAAIWDEYGDIGEASATAEFIIRRDAEIKGFDEDGVVAASDICLWVFRTLKQFKCVSPTTAAVAKLFEGAI